MKSARRIAVVVAAGVLALTAAACSGGGATRAGTQRTETRYEPTERAQAGPGPTRVRLIGDGSTADTGLQPNQPKVDRFKPGQRPPQFVVFSWDGAGEDRHRLFSHFRRLAKKHKASMTYFLSGIYLLPEAKRTLYRPPRHQPGASDIGYLNDVDIQRTVRELRAAWLDGSEIGTHFNGHFCGANGVGSWSVDEWTHEIRQARALVSSWKTNTGLRFEAPLPFDYSKELIGGRAPCLQGQENLIPAAKAMGFRYDSSSEGGLQVWPRKVQGIWDFPLQQIPMPGRSFETLSMDYNFLANQSGTLSGDPSMYAAWEKQTRDGFLAGFRRTYEGNRAPLIIGNHFEQWNGGAYMRAVEDVIERVCTRAEVRCVSFRQLADWLDAQDPRVLASLRTLEVGEKPDWRVFFNGAWPGSPDSGKAGDPGVQQRKGHPAPRNRNPGLMPVERSEGEHEWAEG